MKKLVFISILAALAIAASSCKTKEEPQEPELITIDGDYSDWEKLIKEQKVSVAKLLTSTTYDKKALVQFNVYVDKNNIYFMANYIESDTKPLDIFFATKGEVPTDAINLWKPCYVDYCIEFGKGDTFVEDPADMDWADWNYQQLLAYDHQKGGWNWITLGQNMVTISAKTIYNGLPAVEGKLSRSNFEFTTTYFYVGAYVSNDLMNITGAQPAATIVEEQIVLPEMLKVQLP